jgi:hypothetical protein
MLPTPLIEETFVLQISELLQLEASTLPTSSRHSNSSMVSQSRTEDGTVHLTGVKDHLYLYLQIETW